MNLLYISYDGALDPLGSSQIIPYLIYLSQKGVKFTLLTYEKNGKLRDIRSVNRLKEILANNNIRWEIIRYHRSPTLAATTFDVFMGITKVFIIVLRDKVKIIHARSFVGAIPAFLIAKLLKIKWIFDMRGFWPDERIDGDIWKNKGIIYKVAKWWEKIFILKSDWMTCLTEEAKKITERFPYLAGKKICIDVIPTCADTIKFNIKEKNKGLLTKFKLKDKFIFTYFGSMGTWYLFDQMLEFFQVAKQVIVNSFFLILTLDTDEAFRKVAKHKIDPQDYFINPVRYEEISSWLSIADTSIFFIKPSFSKKSSCPTKFSESLACGLPVVINSGIGDMEKYVNSYNIGVMVERFTRDEYTRAINRLFKILENKDNLNHNCRMVAEEYFSLKRGTEKYWSIYQMLNSDGNLRR